MSATDELKQALQDFSGTGKQAALKWATVKDVDWEEKTMTATGLSDDLDYFDVQLGAGAIIQKPVTDSVVLLGIVEGESSLAFLVSATEVDKIEIRAGNEIEINGGKSGGLVLAPELVGKLNSLEGDMNNLKRAITGWSPVPRDGGAALKAAVTGWAGKTLEKTRQEDIENKKIKQ